MLSIIALITGVLGVWLTIKQNIWCWPVSLISVITSMIDFFSERLFGDASLQLFYFFAGIYGWIFWHQNKNKNFIVVKMKLKWIPFFVLITMIQSIIYFYLLHYFKSDKPLADAILTACSLTATYMMTKKWVENWLVWVVVDFSYVFLCLSKSMYAFVLLNLFFTGFALYGYIKWKKIIQ